MIKNKTKLSRRDFLFVLSIGIISVSFTFSQTKSDERYMVRYVGEDKTANSAYHDGQMRPAIGTQNYQILRANRSHPEWSDGLGWTYNHAPMLAYWNGHFICQYLSNYMGEYNPPVATLITKSKDGMSWDLPQIVFPVYFTTEIREDIPEDQPDDLYASQILDPEFDSAPFKIVSHIMTQRMGFHVAPNGRLLVMGFYGLNDGYGIGRVVREIYGDFYLGPIYFIRVNDNWEGEVKYPLYGESPDEGFVEACESFLSDRIRRIQWWEEDFKAADADTFYMPYDMEKAFCFYTISDSLTIGLFKWRMMTFTTDGGRTWEKPFRAESLTHMGAKIWGQRLNNGQYALVYNPTDNLDRQPLCVAVSDDGLNFDHLSVVHGEVPEKRFWGTAKRQGAQYVRGIVEGNGNPPGDDLWVVYSVNKEDMWISRIPVPIHRIVEGPVRDDFSSMETGGVVNNWNIYSPVWCPVKIVDFPDKGNKSLMLKDFDPYDYARATRVFGQSPRQQLTFELYVESNPGDFYIDICNEKGKRLIKSVIDSRGAVHSINGPGKFESVKSISAGEWVTFTFDINSDDSRYDLYIDGDLYASGHEFSGEGSVERIIFRTGEYRLDTKVGKFKSGSALIPGYDEPGADEPVDEAVFYIRSFSTRNL